MEQQNSTIAIFCSYAREDENLLEQLKKHLSSLRRQYLISMQYDRDLRAGTEWKLEVEKHLNEAHIIMLLISPDFIDSDYCCDDEMKHAIARYERKEAIVIPIIVRPVAWEHTPIGGYTLSSFQVLPKGAKPVTTWNNHDEAWEDVTRGIDRVANELLLSRYHRTIMTVRGQIASTLTTFISGKDVYPDHCQAVSNSLSTSRHPVQGLLDVTQRLSQTTTTIALSYPLSRALHCIEDLASELLPLLKTFGDICRTPSKRMTALREEIQRKLGILVKSMDEIDNVYAQLANQLQHVTSTPHTVTESQSVASSANIYELQPSVPLSVTGSSINLTGPPDEDVTKLCTIVHKKYNRDEFILLCRHFGRSYDDLGEGTLKTRILYFIDDCVRHSKYGQLIVQIRSDHPDLTGTL